MCCVIFVHDSRLPAVSAADAATRGPASGAVSPWTAATECSSSSSPWQHLSRCITAICQQTITGEQLAMQIFSRLQLHHAAYAVGFVCTCLSVSATLMFYEHLNGHNVWFDFSFQRYILYGLLCAFSALTLLVGHQEEHLAWKNWVMRCWCGYLSGARCRLFAYVPADATTSQNPHHLLPCLNPDWFYLSGTGLPRLSWKRGR